MQVGHDFVTSLNLNRCSVPDRMQGGRQQVRWARGEPEPGVCKEK